MITICHPLDDLELLEIQIALEAAEIPCFVFGNQLGSLFPGLQIRSVNEMSIQVPPSCVEEAQRIVHEIRSSRTPGFAELRNRSKVRILLEWLMTGWPVLRGTKRSTKSDVGQSS